MIVQSGCSWPRGRTEARRPEDHGPETRFHFTEHHRMIHETNFNHSTILHPLYKQLPAGPMICWSCTVFQTKNFCGITERCLSKTTTTSKATRIQPCSLYQESHRLLFLLLVRLCVLRSKEHTFHQEKFFFRKEIPFHSPSPFQFFALRL